MAVNNDATLHPGARRLLQRSAATVLSRRPVGELRSHQSQQEAVN